MGLGIGIPELIILSVLLIVPVAIALVALRLSVRAKRLNYPSTGAYLRAAPRSDAERQDAADLVLKGLVFCVLGLLFPPFVLVGLVSMPAWVPLVLTRVAPGPSQRGLAALRDQIARRGRGFTVGLLSAAGLFFTGRGLIRLLG